MSGDWIQVHRKLLESEVFQEGNEHLLRLWMWCLLKASWQDRRKGGRTIRRGQFETTRTDMADWLGGQTKTWYNRLQKLEEWGMVQLKTDNKRTAITVCNYDTYQRNSDINGQHLDSTWTADGQHLDNKGISSLVKNNKEKKGNGDKSPSFDPLSIPVPESLNTEQFQDVWESWCEHRREIKKPLTPTSVKQQLKTLEGWGLARAITALQYTVSQGWQGIREPDTKQYHNGTAGGSRQTWGDLRSEIEAARLKRLRDVGEAD